MQSTMMNVPLTTAAILRHGSSVHGSATVRTLQPDGSVKVASFAEIGEVLRHRSPQTTSIYARIDIDALRPLALPWPGGVQ